ncbi:MAG: hypothetical protein U1F77_18635 [Kiritimatiellia bacterium]
MAGVMELRGAASYTGSTTINYGTLRLSTANGSIPTAIRGDGRGRARR